MFRNILKLGYLSLTTALYGYSFSKYSELQKIYCLETTRNNKIQLVNHLNNNKQECLILVYNRESEDSLKDEIIKIQDLCSSININKLILVDQTDVRHLRNFSNILRPQQKEQSEAIDLQGKIHIFYTNPNYNSNQPFSISSNQDLQNQVSVIRNILSYNPTVEQLKTSLKTFNRTTVIKNCSNQTCIDEYRGKTRKLIEMDLFSAKMDRYKFYLITNKNDANKMLLELEGIHPNKQQIYVHFNDILGESFLQYDRWLEQQGKNITNSNRFQMMIRPRVNIITTINFYRDIIWYMSAIRNLKVPTFCINATIPVDKFKNVKQWPHHDVKLIQELKNKYGNKLHLMILSTQILSQLIRHCTSPWRYSIFQLTRQVPYPKMDLSYLIQNRSSYSQIPNEIISKIDKFIDNPTANSQPISLLCEKQLQINAQSLVQLLEKKQRQWVLRMCGHKNNCEKISAYEKYGLNLQTKVYKLDSSVQNVALDQGDYIQRDGNIEKLM